MSGSRRRYAVGIVGAIVLAGVVSVMVVPGVGYASSSSGRAKACVAHGPRYGRGSSSTRKYSVAVAGVTCSFAKRWVARLLKKHPVRKIVNGMAVGSVPGPRGWQCNTWNYRTGRGVPKHASAGVCATTSPPFKKFGWEPLV